MFIGVIPLILMTLVCYYATFEMVSKKINSSIDNNMGIVAELLDSTLTNLESIADYIGEHEEIKEILRKSEYENYDERFEDVQKIYKIINSIEVKKMDIPIYISGMNNPLSRFTTQPYFSEMYFNVKGYAFSIFDSFEADTVYFAHRRYDGRESKDIVMTIIRRMRDNITDEVLGYVFLDIYDDYFDDVFKKVNLGEESNILILDKKGKIVTDKIYKEDLPVIYGSEDLDYILENEKGSFNFFNKSYMVYFNTLSATEFKVINIVPYNEVYGESTIIIRIFLILLGTMILLSIGSSLVMSGRISKPINELSRLMKRVEDGDLNVEFDYEGKDEIMELGKSFNKMVSELDRLIEEVYLKQYLLKEAELNNLKAQIDPHFLYNTLESIKWMAKLGEGDGVVKMTIALGKLLRYNISSEDNIVTIEDEIKHMKNYLTIQKTRYREKFSVEFQINDDIKDTKILKLLIQPLVENAIAHGLEKLKREGVMIIKGYCKGEFICIEIIDNGQGIKTDGKHRGFGIGLSNVDKRIKLHYGGTYGVTLKRIKDMTHAIIVLPKETI